ncbi:hypothetical protein AWB76_07197 [Caballeronia temeraria]|uniref:Single-stranded DNA-binding protein n=1 Tax=Caballeronia temeraria TaxID=1777137 RepID=A0A158DMH8_9BURK|nr:ssDNA-binding protein [Caballeronia temeraria]SAK95794.1 hypothetical protein AWB76_07197 [Caballeronia temeraria]
MKNFTTPKGPAGYTNLSKPDTKFDPEGKYKTSITLPREQAEKLMELAQEEANELAVLDKKTKKIVMPEGIKYPYVENDDDTVTFTFKTKKKPKLFDAKGNPIRNADDLRIGGGSTIRVKGAFSSYEGFGGGVTAYLNEVQLIKLVEFGGEGFQPEDDEDGYVASNEAPSSFNDESEGSDDSSEEDGNVDF